MGGSLGLCFEVIRYIQRRKLELTENAKQLPGTAEPGAL